jgi:hypothetical protein
MEIRTSSEETSQQLDYLPRYLKESVDGPALRYPALAPFSSATSNYPTIIAFNNRELGTTEEERCQKLILNAPQNSIGKDASSRQAARSNLVDDGVERRAAPVNGPGMRGRRLPRWRPQQISRTRCELQTSRSCSNRRT